MMTLIAVLHFAPHKWSFLSAVPHSFCGLVHISEIYFPMKNVRYIAVNDCVDTASKNNDIAALKNVINEFYSRDNSRKIRSSIRARAKAGLYRTAFNPIGYRKAPDNHNRLIVDTETAWIVKRIFELTMPVLPMRTGTKRWLWR